MAQSSAIPPALLAMLQDAVDQASGFAVQQKQDLESLKRSSHQVSQCRHPKALYWWGRRSAALASFVHRPRHDAFRSHSLQADLPGGGRDLERDKRAREHAGSSAQVQIWPGARGMPS